MTEPLGISVGTTTLFAARAGAAPVSRPAAVRIGDQVWTDVVDRVGDPVPLIGDDGVAHRAEQLLALALAELADTEGSGLAAVAGVAVPAHWGPGRRDALRDALWRMPALAHTATPPLLVSDATAALRSLQSAPGLPGHGVIVVCDVGAVGASITLADAGADYRQIGETARLTEFSSADSAFLRALDATLERSRIVRGDVTAVAAIGEGATPAVGGVRWFV